MPICSFFNALNVDFVVLCKQCYLILQLCQANLTNKYSYKAIFNSKLGVFRYWKF